MGKDAKKKLFRLFDVMSNKPDLYFDYRSWDHCFIAHYAEMYCIDKDYYHNCIPSEVFNCDYFNITGEQYVDMFCNFAFLNEEHVQDVKFHIKRIKKYIKDNNL